MKKIFIPTAVNLIVDFLLLAMFILGIGLAMESNSFKDYLVAYTAIIIALYAICTIGSFLPILVKCDDEKISVRYLLPNLNKTFYWKEVNHIELCKKIQTPMLFGMKTPNFFLSIQQEKEEITIEWLTYPQINLIYLHWLKLHPDTINVPNISIDFQYKLFKRTMWGLFTFYQMILVICMGASFLYLAFTNCFPLYTFSIGTFVVACSYFGLGQHFFYLEWDAHHLYVKNDLMPFRSRSIAWEDIRFIKLTTLYKGDTLLLAGKDYALKAYIIEAVPKKFIKEIYRTIKKNGIPIENDINN